MNPNQLKQLEKLAKVFNTSNIISPEDIQEVLKGIALLLADYRKGTVELTEDVKKTFEDVINTISDEHDKVLKEVKNTSETAKSEATEAITKSISEMKRMCAEVMEMKPKDGEKGEDADEEKIIEEVLAKIKLPEYKEVVLDDGAEIISKINDEKVAKINASQIEGLPTFEGKPNGGGWRNLNQLHDVNLSNLANNDVLKYNSTTELWENGVGGGGSGTVTSVAATVPTGLTISGSPITAAGTLAIALDTGYVIPLQTTLDGKANTALSNLASVAINTSLISDTDNTDDLGSALIGWRTGYFSTSILTPTVTADTSAGLLLESANGTDVGLLGSGNTANVEWYGSHNFDTATQDTIAAFTGAGKTLGSLATATYPSLTELSYVKGVTSAIQTQFTGKEPTIAGAGANTVWHGNKIFSAVVEADMTLSDNTTNNATTLRHGFLPKLSGNALQYLDGNGNYSTPTAGIANSYSLTAFTSQTSVNIVHNFGTYPNVQVIDNTGAVVIPLSIVNNTLNDFTVTFTASTTGNIIATVGSPQPQALTTVNSDYTVLITDRIIKVTAAAKTITLPTAVGNTGREYIINNASSGDITVATTSSQTITDELTQILPSKSSMTVYSDGANYQII